MEFPGVRGKRIEEKESRKKMNFSSQIALGRERLSPEHIRQHLENQLFRGLGKVHFLFFIFFF